MQDDPFERLSPLRHHEQPQGGPLGSEGLLDRPAAGDELLVRPERREWPANGATGVFGAAESATIDRRASEPGAIRGAGSWPAAPRLVRPRSIGRATARLA
jgi:hypothetical protein